MGKEDGKGEVLEGRDEGDKRGAYNLNSLGYTIHTSRREVKAIGDRPYGGFIVKDKKNKA